MKIPVDILEEIKNLILEENWCIDKSVGMDCDYYEPLDNEYKNILLYLVYEEINKQKFNNHYLKEWNN